MAFVITQGQIAAVDRSLFPNAPTVQLGTEVIQDYAQIWRSQPNIRTVVDFLARNIAQLPIQIFRRVSETDRQRLNDHPLAKLLKRPNFFTTRYRLIDTLIHDMGIYDNGFWVKIRTDQGTTGLVRVDPRMMTPMGKSFLNPEEYLLRGNGGYLTIPAESVVHFRGYNPDNPRWGCSPIETLRRTLAEEYQAGVYREQLWRNSARISGYLSRPADAPQWDEKGKQRFREQWQSQYAGVDAQRAGGTPILEDGMTFNQASVTPEQAQYLENRKLTREECAAAYHIPLPMVGILDHATYSNMNQAHAQLYMDTLGPWLQQLSEDMELQLLPDFDDSGQVYTEFNIAAKLAGSFEEQAAVLQTAVGAPYMLRNEARARLNLPEIDGGSELVTPLNVLIGGQASPTDSAPPPNPLTPPKAVVQWRCKVRPTRAHVDRITKTMSAYFARQHTVIASRLGAKAAVDDAFDTDRWDAELTGDLFNVAGPVAASAARKVLDQLGVEFEYDEGRTRNWLHEFAAQAAAGINGATKASIADVLAGGGDILAELDKLFSTYQSSRAEEIGITQSTALSGFGSEESVRQTGSSGTKTWIVTSGNPRASHSAMAGETVEIGETFSNGALWPGDSNLDVAERARCTCDLEMTISSN